MGRWWNTGQITKANLAAGSVAALLLVAACGDNDEEDQAKGKTFHSVSPQSGFGTFPGSCAGGIEERKSV